MLKRILVLLGETRSSVAARRYAFDLARRQGARLTGLGGVDLAYLDEPMIGGIGTATVQAGLEQALENEADEIRRRLRDVFARECKEHGIDLEWISFDGDPIETLCLATETCDLVVAGHDISFRGALQEHLSETLSNLLQMTPRPVIVCPDEAPAGEAIMIAYDGSVPAMRALQIFTLLGIERGRPICVTSVDSNEERATRRSANAAAYLQMHGYETESRPLASDQDPAELLRKEVADRGIGTLVMGAYGHRGFREFFFGSTTSTLAETPPCALFLYH